MLRRFLIGLFAATLAAAIACGGPPIEALQLDGNLLTVNNRSSSDWTNVELWVNNYFRATTASIPAGGRFQAPLDTFVTGFGQRFDFRRMQIHDVRLTAKQPDGRPVELKKELTASGLPGALRGTR